MTEQLIIAFMLNIYWKQHFYSINTFQVPHYLQYTQIIYGAAGMAAGNQIELGNLILVVVVVVCSYGLALILAVNEFVNFSIIFWIITEL